MQVLFPRCAGLDVHKKTIVACRVRRQANGHKEQEVRTFGTTTRELLLLLDWLREWGCTHVAMESTGEYWRPIYNLLEGHLEVWLVNARHAHRVPARKTDVRDAEWLAELLCHGLVKPSFVPPQPQRYLRDLTRQRANLVEERARVVNRLQKVLEHANLKLASVATDVTGVSAREMLRALIEGQTDPEALAELARGRMRSKKAALAEALEGCVRDHHRFLLLQHLTHLDFLEGQIELFSAEVVAQLERMSTPAAVAAPDVAPAAGTPAGGLDGESGQRPSFTEAVRLLDPVPGIGEEIAQTVVAELGTDMGRFPTDRHVTAWAGVAPGNNESAGKRYSGKTTPGNPALRKALVQAARGAVKVKGAYFGALYRRLVGRRGKKRALVAVARALLVAIYHILRTGRPYHELGADYFDQLDRQGMVQRLTARLARLGYEVRLEPRPLPVAA